MEFTIEYREKRMPYPLEKVTEFTKALLCCRLKFIFICRVSSLLIAFDALLLDFLFFFFWFKARMNFAIIWFSLL